jgi:hypothetical protein
VEHQQLQMAATVELAFLLAFLERLLITLAVAAVEVLVGLRAQAVMAGVALRATLARLEQPTVVAAAVAYLMRVVELGDLAVRALLLFLTQARSAERVARLHLAVETPFTHLQLAVHI